MGHDWETEWEYLEGMCYAATVLQFGMTVMFIQRTRLANVFAKVACIVLVYLTINTAMVGASYYVARKLSFCEFWGIMTWGLADVTNPLSTNINILIGVHRVNRLTGKFLTDSGRKRLKLLWRFTIAAIVVGMCMFAPGAFLFSIDLDHPSCPWTKSYIIVHNVGLVLVDACNTVGSLYLLWILGTEIKTDRALHMKKVIRFNCVVSCLSYKTIILGEILRTTGDNDWVHSITVYAWPIGYTIDNLVTVMCIFLMFQKAKNKKSASEEARTQSSRIDSGGAMSTAATRKSSQKLKLGSSQVKSNGQNLDSAVTTGSISHGSPKVGSANPAAVNIVVQA